MLLLPGHRLCHHARPEACRSGRTKTYSAHWIEHKLARGYLPTKTYSAHWIENESFAAAVSEYLERERAHVEHGIEVLGEYSPFRRGDATDLQEDDF